MSVAHTDSDGCVGAPVGGRVRVLIVDDHELVRSGIRSLLAADERILVVGEAEGFEQAMARVAALRPDVMTVDLRLGGPSGCDVCAAVAAQYPAVRTLVLTSFPDDDAVVSAIRAGASGFLLKTVEGARLGDAVVRVAAGQSVIDPAVTRRVLDHIRSPEQPAHRHLPSLTEIEIAVLARIAEGLTNREIALLVDLSPTTVKNHVSSILHKLGFSTRTELAVFAVRAGVPPPRPRSSAPGPSGTSLRTPGQ